MRFYRSWLGSLVLLFAALGLSGCNSCCKAQEICKDASCFASPLQKLTVTNHSSKEVKYVGTNLQALTPGTGISTTYNLDGRSVDSVYAGLDGFNSVSDDVPAGKTAAKIDLYIELGAQRANFTYK